MQNAYKLKVLHIGTEITASSAPLRIHNAVKRAGIDSKILVLRKKIENEDIEQADRDIISKISSKISYYTEKIKMGQYQEKEDVPFSFGTVGTCIYKNRLVQDADILHLHWINGQYLSYSEIGHLVQLGKPVVWTFHDSWPMTGGCHVRYGCERFMQSCGYCPLLHSQKQKDITYEILKNKRKFYRAEQITAVAPSKWMFDNICQSSLFLNSRHELIGNPLDMNLYSDNYKKKDKDDKIIKVLFGASGALELEYKGYIFFVQAMHYIQEKYPQLAEKIVIYVFGTEKAEYKGLEGYRSIPLGYIYSEKEMVSVYNMADIYVFPSIDDNLPGTVMESLACKTPVVAFQTGGVPEMVKHKQNGYIAEYKNARDLAEGIRWVYENNDNNSLGEMGRSMMREKYGYDVIAEKYCTLYRQLKERVDGASTV